MKGRPPVVQAGVGGKPVRAIQRKGVVYLYTAGKCLEPKAYPHGLNGRVSPVHVQQLRIRQFFSSYAAVIMKASARLDNVSVWSDPSSDSGSGWQLIFRPLHRERQVLGQTTLQLAGLANDDGALYSGLCRLDVGEAQGHGPEARCVVLGV